MDMKQFTGTKYLSASDLPRPRVVVIENLEVEMIGEPKERKPILYMQNVEKGLPLNKTNTDMLISLLGEDSDDWMGKRIELYVDPNVKFGGKPTPAVRVRAPRPQATAPAGKRAANLAPVDAVTDADEVADPA